MFIRNQKGDIELSYLAKIIISLIALIVIFILIATISGEFGSSSNDIKDAFEGFN